MIALELDTLLSSVRARATGIDSSLHGERHWQCVAHLGSDLAGEVPKADGLVVFLFGLLHDTMRENDGSDPEHGGRAAGLARELGSDGLLSLDDDQLELLCEACERHAYGEISSDPTIGVCWDADRLNLWRVGTTPHPALLSTTPARRTEWITGAPALAHHAFSGRALYAAHQGPPTPESFWIEAGRLLAGKYAGSLSRADAGEKIARLVAAGVTEFVDLTEQAELEPYSHLIDGVARHLRFPIPDVSCTTAEHMERILNAIDDELARGGVVYIHCWGGCGRTGTVVGCWLVRHGVSPEVALARFASASFATCKRACPETSRQQAIVLGWKPRVMCREGADRKVLFASDSDEMIDRQVAPWADLHHSASQRDARLKDHFESISWDEDEDIEGSLAATDEEARAADEADE